MPITHSEATTILLQVRQFYKRGEKSSNKRYHLRAAGPLTYKQYNRNRNVDEIDVGEAAAFLDYLLDKYSAVDIGEQLIRRGYKVGNCVQMCCLTAYVIDSDHSNDVLNMCAVMDPGDHVFLSVGSGSPQWQNIRSMAQDTSDAMIIDCWANIACGARDYPQYMREKLITWSGQDKQVFANDRWDYPDGDYLNNMLEGPLSIGDARASPT